MQVNSRRTRSGYHTACGLELKAKRADACDKLRGNEVGQSTTSQTRCYKASVFMSRGCIVAFDVESILRNLDGIFFVHTLFCRDLREESGAVTRPSVVAKLDHNAMHADLRPFEKTPQRGGESEEE